MGKIKQGILGGFANKVGTVIGSSWKGIAVMRSMPLSVANPKTAAQVAVRGKFSQVVNIAQRELAEVVQKNFNRQAKQMSGYNLFCKLNMDSYKDKTFSQMQQGMIFSKGVLSCSNVRASWDSDDNRWVITTDRTNIAAKDQSSDILQVVILDFASDANGLEDATITNVLSNTTTRTFGNCVLPAMTRTAGHTYVAYVYYESADEKEFSNSVAVVLPNA